MPAEPATDGLDDLRAAQRLLQRLVAIADAPASIERLRAAGFDDAGLAPADAAVLAATDVRHLGIYRKLVRRTLRNTIALQLPRTAARLGERYASEIDAFCESELPRSPLLRDVAFEMVRWATPRWQQGDGVEPWLGQLARYELLEFAVYAAERSAAGAERPDAPELDAAAAVCFDGTTRLARFDYAVHELPDDPDDRSLPDGTPAHLLCYRDDDGCFVRIELTPICGELLGRLWLQQQPLGPALAASCAAHQRSLDQAVVDETAELLADLAARKVVLGRRPPTVLAAPPFAAWLYHPRPHAPAGARS